MVTSANTSRLGRPREHTPLALGMSETALTVDVSALLIEVEA